MKAPTPRTILRANVIALIAFICLTLYLAWAYFSWPSAWPIADEKQTLAMLPQIQNIDGARAMLRSCLTSREVDGQMQRTLLQFGLQVAVAVSFFSVLLFWANVDLLRKLRSEPK